jgi:DNA-binding CsgD family transcriptional regulator
MLKSPPTPGPAELSRLISLVYEAPFLPSGWRHFTSAAAKLMQTHLAMIHHMDHVDHARSLHVAGGIDEAFSKAFSPRWPAGGDDFYLQAMLDQPAGTIRLGCDIVDPEVAHQTEIYHQLAEPWQLEHFLFASLGSHDGMTSVLSLGRSVHDAPFSTEEIDLLAAALLPHLCRSISVHTSLTNIRQNNALLATIIDMAPSGIVAFDAGGMPLLVNQSAATVFARDDGLALRNGKMRATDSPIQALLDAALLASVALSRGQPAVPPAPVLVPRKGETRPYQVVFSPFMPNNGAADFPRRTACIAMIHDHRHNQHAEVSANLGRTWGLSKAEVRVCETLLSGKTAHETAVALNISPNTVKTHLSRIFHKTGVHSQTALLHLMNTRSPTRN